MRVSYLIRNGLKVTKTAVKNHRLRTQMRTPVTKMKTVLKKEKLMNKVMPINNTSNNRKALLTTTAATTIITLTTTI